MEINTYNIRKDNDEFKDLTEDQLMKIAELCMKYYKKGVASVQEDTDSELQDEIDNLEQQLEDADYEYNKLARDFDELKDQYDELKQELAGKDL